MIGALRLSFWRVVFYLIMAAAVYAAYVRVTQGLGGSTNLSDRFPWGLWVGFDVLCGVGLAAGGFTLAAIVHIFNLKTYKPVVRPAILTAFLGYLLVIVALMFDLGRPWNIWHPIIMWNPRSVMFEVAWCVTLYTTVLFLEFLPMALDKLGWEKPKQILKGVMIPIVVLGVILSTLHQSSLGSLFLILPSKLHPLWYSPLLPILFYVSAIAVGLAMTIFESWHSAKAFGRELEWPLVQRMSRVLAVVIAVYLTIRLLDVSKTGALATLTQQGWERWMFLGEIALIAVPMLMLFSERTRRSPRAVYLSVVLFLLGFVANRLNVSVTGLEASSGVAYFPKWTEIAITLAMVAAGFAIFRIAAQYLSVFEHPVESVREGQVARVPVIATAQIAGD